MYPLFCISTPPPVKGGAQIALTPSCRRLGCIPGPKHFLPPSWSSRENGWTIPTARVGHKYAMDPGDKTFIFVCFLHFCVHDFCCLSNTQLFVCPKSRKGETRGGGFRFSERHQFDLFEVAGNFKCYMVIPPHSDTPSESQ